MKYQTQRVALLYFYGALVLFLAQVFALSPAALVNVCALDCVLLLAILLFLLL